MNKEELINWFWNEYNSCYFVTHLDYPQSVFLFYDEQFNRKLKLCKISGKSIKLPSKVTGICLFELDYKNNWFHYNYDEIYQFLYKNYNHNYFEINDFVKDMLNDASKLQVLTPFMNNTFSTLKLNDASKLQVLTPNDSRLLTLLELYDDSKLNLLTPIRRIRILNHQLDEVSKLQVLIPNTDIALSSCRLKDDSKLNLLTSFKCSFRRFLLLDEINKLQILIPKQANILGLNKINKLQSFLSKLISIVKLKNK